MERRQARGVCRPSDVCRRGGAVGVDILRAAAWLPLSLSDDPGRVAAVVFFAGCNLRCPFCHNPDLVLPERIEPPGLDPGEILAALGERRGFIDSVVLSGGEPTLQEGLAEFAAALRGEGFRVKLDTNGTRPDVLAELLDRGVVDYVAMDVKAPKPRYAEFAGTAVDRSAIEESIRLVQFRARDGEFRTTVAPGLREDDLLEIAAWLRGARRYVLQPFRIPPEKGLVDATLQTEGALDVDSLRDAWSRIAPLVRGGGVRG